MAESESKIELTSEIDVSLVSCAGDDRSMVRAAKVSTQGAESLDTDTSEGLIRFLLRNRHGTPFEHNSMTFLVQAPIFVFREWHRHRVGWSYNEESGRYKELAPRFYVPPQGRPLVQTGKPGHYEFVAGTRDQENATYVVLRHAAEDAYRRYRVLLKSGIAREVARMVLPVNIYSSMYATCNARSLMHFLSLRTKSETATFPSYPQWEIEQAARAMEDAFGKLFPLTYAAFCEFGRVAP